MFLWLWDMFLAIVSVIVLLIVVSVVVLTFFPRVKGIMRLVVIVWVTFLIMWLLSSWFGLFEVFALGKIAPWLIWWLAVAWLVYFLLTLTWTARRILLFVLAVVVGLMIALFIWRWLNFGSKWHVTKKSTQTSDAVAGVVQWDVVVVNNPESQAVVRGEPCALPRWWYIEDGSYTYAYDKRTSDVCDAQMRYCADGDLSGSYSMQSCDMHDDSWIAHHDTYNTPNADRVATTPQKKKKDGFISLPSLDGSQWHDNNTWFHSYDLNGKRIDPNNPNSVEVTWIAVQAPEPQWNVNTQVIYDCQTPWGERVKNGQFVKAYASPEWYGEKHCQTQLRLCRNGELMGTFWYPSCEYINAY